MIFDIQTKIDLKFIKNFTKLNKLKILDLGCGIGAWNKKDIKKKFIQKIILYDNNKKLIKKLKKKYKEKKVKIIFDLNKIINKENFNLVIISSVIQYIGKEKLKKLIDKITKNINIKKENFYIFILDIPRFPRMIEFFLLPLFDCKRFLFVSSLFLNKDYKKINYHIYNNNDLSYLEKKFFVTKIKNLLKLKILRYSLVLKLKK